MTAATEVTVRRMLRVEWDRTLGWSMLGAAQVGFLWGYRHLAAAPLAAEEVAYVISGGLGMLVMLLAGVALLLTADLRDEHSKLDGLDEAVFGKAVPRSGQRFWFGRMVAAVALGAAAVAVGWARASGTGDLDRALTGLVIAAIGSAVTGAVLTAHLALARRGVVARRDAVLGAVHGALAAPGPETAADRLVDPLWTAPGLRRAHVRGCAALASARTAPVPVSPAETDRELCRLCHRSADGRA